MWPASADSDSIVLEPVAIVRNVVGVTTLSLPAVKAEPSECQVLTARILAEATTPAIQFPCHPSERSPLA